MALLSLLLTYKVSMVKTASVHCYNCVFFLAFSFSALSMSSKVPWRGRAEWKNGKLGEGNIFSYVI